MPRNQFVLYVIFGAAYCARHADNFAFAIMVSSQSQEFANFLSNPITVCGKSSNHLVLHETINVLL